MAEKKAEGGKWVDPDFPANADSICKSDEVSGDFQTYREQVVWKRATDLFDTPCVFSSDVHPDDINQTNVGFW